MRWSRAVLVILLLLDVWYRAHTFAPVLRDKVRVDLWPGAVGASEPLDCDEAAYAYIGHRILRGDVLYRDVTENKTPLGYWLYTLAVAVGGYNELAIRIMPIPFVLATIALVWWIAGRLAGPLAACMAAALYILLSTDPFLFGNGSNFEHFINFFSVASLAILIRAWRDTRRWPLCAAGACLSAAALVKQIAIFPVLVYGPALLLRIRMDADSRPGKLGGRILDVLALGVGVTAIAIAAGSVVVVQGAAKDAFDDIFFYGRALATDTLPEPNAPLGIFRWLTGNADPLGRLPWPFGTTDYLVWWGSASWPLWLASIPALAYLFFGRGTTPERRLVAGWTVAAWAQVTLPGLYWQHYYLLPIAGAAIAVAVCLADAFLVLSVALRVNESPSSVHRPGGFGRGRHRFAVALVCALGLMTAVGATAVLEVRSYLMIRPEQLTVRWKGGGQWVALRKIGRELNRRARVWNDPHLYIWGWQSPLYFYGQMDSPTRHFFVDNLLRDQADRNHPLIHPRTEEIVAALKRRPPELIFTGYMPFRKLQKFLNEHYVPSRLVAGLWVRQKDYGSFERAGAPSGASGGAGS